MLRENRIEGEYLRWIDVTVWGDNVKAYMSLSEIDLETLVLSKPPGFRAYLAERILSSFDSPSQKRIDELWSKEVEDRIDAFERGEILAVGEGDAYEETEKRLR